ncbi:MULTISPECIES: hypothetical protein [Streptomyces]|uniref:hypothetical protein n=1 Tax=Streptomyces TaxID=1883 RepID=UPI001603880D|nr:hypothetical protein [Streptomyces murinus]MBA9050800.1 hypothetical protein [Streptomyces murinus]
MAFYIVVDGKKNAAGEADTFVVRASGRRLAAATAPLADRKGATVLKLEDGREYPNGVMLSSLVEHEAPELLDMPTLIG